MYELKTVVLSLSCTLKLPEESLQAAPQSNLTRILRVGFDIKKKKKFLKAVPCNSKEQPKLRTIYVKVYYYVIFRICYTFSPRSLLLFKLLLYPKN